MALDRLIERHCPGSGRERFHGLAWEGHIGEHKVMMLKPATYMNLSGTAVSEAATFHKVVPSNLLVLVDDTALPVGSIRLRPGGSSGGHNGLADIERRIGTRIYPRLRIGVGAPEIDGQRINLSDYVLGRFTDEDMHAVEPALDRSADTAECWLAEGLDAAMKHANTQNRTRRWHPAILNLFKTHETDTELNEVRPMSTKEKPLYEAMFLFDPANISSSLATAIETTQQILSRADAEVLSIFKWDDRKLAYDIRTQKRGLYILAYFRTNGEKIASIERDVSLSEQVARAMVLRAEHIGETELNEAIEKQAASLTEAALQAERAKAKQEAAEAEAAAAGNTDATDDAEAEAQGTAAE